MSQNVAAVEAAFDVALGIALAPRRQRTFSSSGDISTSIKRNKIKKWDREGDDCETLGKCSSIVQ